MSEKKAVAGGVISASGVQHKEMYRKLLLRRRMLRWARPGAAYVPFIGDGDIAAELYNDRQVYGADLDDGRLAVAHGRLKTCQVELADCDGWPFPGLRDTIAIADFDAYVDPYIGFQAMWAGHRHFADQLVLFFTDGRRYELTRYGLWRRPDGVRVSVKGAEKTAISNSYLSRHILPWFTAHVAPWRILEVFRYQRAFMVYWGCAIERPKLTKKTSVTD